MAGHLHVPPYLADDSIPIDQEGGALDPHIDRKAPLPTQAGGGGGEAGRGGAIKGEIKRPPPLLSEPQLPRPFSSRAASSTSCAWPGTFTFRHTLWMTPSRSIRKVARSIPI